MKRTLAVGLAAAGSLGLAGTASAAPTVDLSDVVKAAKLDPSRPDGGTTAGSKADVQVVEAALFYEGLLGYGYVDGSYGTKTISAYGSWQRSLGYTGADADGIPGLTSLRKLGNKWGFNVVQ
ncbi:MAG: hypothetical protein PGN13_05020 [Patulibacter minatonensis]